MCCDFCSGTYGLTLPRSWSSSSLPRSNLGEYASPLAFELAKKLRKAPRRSRKRSSPEIGPIEGFAEASKSPRRDTSMRKIDRAGWRAALAPISNRQPTHPGKILVEHTSINPNKAAHIGHLRNAILGRHVRPPAARCRQGSRCAELHRQHRRAGRGRRRRFLHLEKKVARRNRATDRRQPRFDYYCWDLYARVSQWYEADKQNKQVRLQTLHAIEDRRKRDRRDCRADLDRRSAPHLETMDRLDIEYDFLPRESEILHLHFWDAAFEAEGKRRALLRNRRQEQGLLGDAARTGPSAQRGRRARRARFRRRPESHRPLQRHRRLRRQRHRLSLWKFGLLGRDFGYRKFYRYPNEHRVLDLDRPTARQDHPHFGDVAEIYNVIDARQSDPQNTVIEALRGLGHGEAADHYTHFSYEMVALTPRCAAELGYELSEEDKAGPTSRSPAARASASRPTTCSTS